MDDLQKIMEEQIKQQNADFEKTLEEALEQQKTMNDEMGFETTEEDRQSLIDDYKQQAQMQEAMIRQQFEIQKTMMSAYGNGQMADIASQAMAQMQAYQNLIEEDDDEDYDDEMSEEDLQTFINEHPVPDDMKKFLTIGLLLTANNEEPYTTLALIGDKEDYRDSISENWDIDGREDALDMLKSLLKGRHSEAFKEDYAILREHGADGYFEHTDDPTFDEDDIETFEIAKDGLTEVLELAPEYAQDCDSLYAWDLERIGLLCRILCHVGYITEKEAFDWLKKAGKKASETFDSWEAYIVSLLLGRALHLGVSQEHFDVAYDLLHDNKEILDSYPIETLK